MTGTIEADKRTEVVALEALGLGSFVRVDVATPRRFEKEVIKVGSYKLPDGRLLEILPTKVGAERRRNQRGLAAGIDELAENTNAWIRLGQKVWFPEAGGDTDAHNSVASLNRGYWEPSFRVVGDALMGVVEAVDDSVAAKLGKTIQDVSAAIAWNVESASQKHFDVVIEHVCATSFPVVPGQRNFVPLARHVRAKDQERKNMGDTTDKDKAQLAADDGAEKPSMTPNQARTILAAKCGLDINSDWGAIVKCMMDGGGDDSDDGSQPGEPGMLSRRSKADAAKLEREIGDKVRAELDSEVQALKARADRERKRWAEGRVNVAKREAASLGRPLEKDVTDRALALLARGDEDSEKDAELMLKASVAGASERSIPFARLENKGLRSSEAEQGSELQDAMLARRGFERTPEGEVVKKRGPSKD